MFGLPEGIFDTIKVLLGFIGGEKHIGTMQDDVRAMLRPIHRQLHAIAKTCMSARSNSLGSSTLNNAPTQG
jgi:hypothetical protein